MLYRKQYILLCVMSTCLSLTGAALHTPEHLFKPDEYEHYMELIKKIDPRVHIQLRNCANELGEPCIKKSQNRTSSVAPGTNLSNGYPMIILASMRNKPEAHQKEILTLLIKRYTDIKNTLPITKTEQKEILDIIKDIAPELHQELISLNKIVAHPYTQKQLIHTVQDHIRRNYDDGFAVNICPFEGLPIIWVDQDSFIDNPNPQEQFKAAIAHELGHYILQHLANNQTRSKSGFKQLQKAHSRTEEFEADRSMVLDFDIPIDIAIENAQTLHMEESSDTHTFKRTHPLWADRIKHIKSLQSEVELKKAHSKGKTVFDWQILAQEYLHAVSKQ